MGTSRLPVGYYPPTIPGSVRPVVIQQPEARTVFHSHDYHGSCVDIFGCAASCKVISCVIVRMGVHSYADGKGER